VHGENDEGRRCQDRQEAQKYQQGGTRRLHFIDLFAVRRLSISMSSSFVDVHPWCLALQFVGRGGGCCMLSAAQPIQAIARLVVYVDLLV